MGTSDMHQQATAHHYGETAGLSNPYAPRPYGPCIASPPPWPGGRAPVVLQVIPALETGGAERGCVDVALALAEAGATPLVASSGGGLVRELDRAFIKHVKLPLATKNPLKIHRNAGILAQIIKEYGVDIVHARSRAPAWSAQIACGRTGARYMTTFHAPYNFSWELKKRYNSVMARGERVIAISDFIRRHVEDNYAVEPERIRLIHRCYDPAVFSPDRVSAARMIQLATQWRLPDHKPVVMLPARLTRWKGQTVLIDALAKLKRRDVHCLLVGSDQGRTGFTQELQSRIHRLGLDGFVHITGHCSDMAAAYALSTVVVSASREPEAFGRVIVEAQAMGKPVIVSDTGAVKETVAAGETGWVVPVDDPDALAAALNQALDLTHEQLEIVGEHARAFVAQHFTKERMCADTLSVYAELMAEGTPV
jgi:glycosyltransferase involved in cell wall biosynthesis